MTSVAQILGSRFLSTLLHVVLPTTSVLVIALMLWIGFSGQRKPIIRTGNETGGATNLVYSGRFDTNAMVNAIAETVTFLPERINALKVSGSIDYLGGEKQLFNSEKINTDWDLSYVGFERGTLSQTFKDGSKLNVWIVTGSAGQNGIVGRKVIATLDNNNVAFQELVAEQVFVKADGTMATADGGAVWTWLKKNDANWFMIESEGFTVFLNQSVIETTGPADFEFFGGNGNAGLLRVKNKENDDGKVLEFLNGVEIQYYGPNNESKHTNKTSLLSKTQSGIDNQETSNRKLTSNRE